MFIQITQVWAHYFKLFNRVQPIQDEKARFIKGNELKFSYFHFFFKRVNSPAKEKILKKWKVWDSGKKEEENQNIILVCIIYPYSEDAPKWTMQLGLLNLKIVRWLYYKAFGWMAVYNVLPLLYPKILKIMYYNLWMVHKSIIFWQFF